MNLGELRGAVNRRTGIAVDTAALNDWINFALTEIALEDRWPWLEAQTTFTTVAGTNVYTLTPTTVRTVISVVDANGNAYDPASDRDLLIFSTGDDLVSQFSEDGKWFSAKAQQLRIAPTPSSAFVVTVSYISNEPRLLADIDSPLLPEVYHEAIIERAALEVVSRRNQVSSDSRKADMYMKNYNRLLMKMKREALRYVGPARTPRIRPGAGW